MHPRDASDYRALEDGDPRQIQEQEESSDEEQKTPLALWPVFVFSIIAGGTSAPVTYLMQRAAPISVTGWRHQVTALVMLPSFLYETFHLDSSERKRALTGRNLALHFLSALAIGAHLVAYTAGVYMTSIPHSVFLSATSPVYVALYVKFRGGRLLPMELGGVFITFVGMGIFALDRGSEQGNKSTFLGDFVAVLAAIFMAIYLMIGTTLRSWMPLFVFQYPIVVVDMLLVGLAGIAFEGWNNSDTGVITGPFGWLRKENFWPVIWLGVVAGFIGQAGYGYVIKYAAPLVMPTGLCTPPIIASVLSWLLGQTPIPGASTWIGGLVIFTGSTIVSIASTLRKTQEEARKHQHEEHKAETPT